MQNECSLEMRSRQLCILHLLTCVFCKHIYISMYIYISFIYSTRMFVWDLSPPERMDRFEKFFFLLVQSWSGEAFKQKKLDFREKKIADFFVVNFE